MQRRLPLLLSLTWLVVSFTSVVQAASLIVGSTNILDLGDPQQVKIYAYDSIRIEAGGRLNLLGDVTITVVGNVEFLGVISVTPTGKATNGSAGTNGADGPNNQVTGANAGSGGTLGGAGAGWTFGGQPRFELNSQGTVIIEGGLLLNPKFDGGDGGGGGNGGSGGSGASQTAGAGGGFGGQAGQGGQGGHAGLPGATVSITAKRIELRPGSLISLDNDGKGGKGGDGGNGGNGGLGGNGTSGNGGVGGGGGPSGSGGTGGQGGNGGTLYLTAPALLLQGKISLRGGAGGQGGKPGQPGNGGNGGNAVGTDPGWRGGNGGNAGSYLDFGVTGGRGGPGGNGGSLYLNYNANISLATFDVSGGDGGVGGTNLPAAAAQGGQGGTPGGAAGANSVALPQGASGKPGVPGVIYVFLGGGYWTLTNQCFTRLVSTDSSVPFELSFDYRWLATSGAVEFLLVGQSLLRLEAPPALSGSFEHRSLIFSDPSLRNRGSQPLTLCINPEGAAEVQNIVWRQAPEANIPQPVVSVRRLSVNSGIEFTWTSVTNGTYRFQVRSSLTQGSWSDLGAAIQGTGATLTGSDMIAPGQSQKFYRLVVSSSP